MKTSGMTIKIDYRKKARLEAIAKKQGRSLSSLLQQIIKEFVNSYEAPLCLEKIPADIADNPGNELLPRQLKLNNDKI